jgi:LacI family transcriptional regulator
MDNRRVTIKDIAEKAGVSFSTVGRAMRNEPLVRKNTKKKIIKIAEELGYFPNLQAKSLRSNKSKTIGVILNDLKNPFYPDFIRTIGEILTKMDYTMLLADSNLNLRLEKKNIVTMLSKNVDGILFSPINKESDNIDIIRKNSIKTVFIDCYPDIGNIDYVYGNHERQAFIATEHLIKNGHKNILLLNGPSRLSSSNLFLEGYIKALSHYNIKKREELIKHMDMKIKEGYELFEKIYKDKSIVANINFTAILTLSDLIAIGIYQAVKKLNLKIPEDYSIIGCDNTFTAEHLTPPLTSVYVSKTETGKKSIKMLMDKINGEDNKNSKIVLKPKLKKRGSVKNTNN